MRKLRKSEVNKIIKENSVFSNDELLKKYFDILFNYVFSALDLVKEDGREEADVRERRRHEDYMSCYAHILEWMLRERGVNPWSETV